MTTPPKSGFKLDWRAAVVWVAIWAAGAFGVSYLARSLDWAAVDAAVAQASLIWVLAAFGCNLVAMPLWYFAWRALTPIPPPPMRLLETQAVTLAAIQTLSILGGGVVAVVMLVRRAQVSAAVAATIVALDQALTGAVKVILILAALIFSPAPSFMRTAAAILLPAVLVFVGLLTGVSFSHGFVRRFSLRQKGWMGRALLGFADLAGHLAAVRAPHKVGLALALYAARKSTEGFAALCIMRACGVAPSPEAAILVVAAIALSTVIPGPPGNLGIYEASVVFAYTQTGIAPELALALALLQHAAYLAASVLPGLGALILWPPWSYSAKRNSA